MSLSNIALIDDDTSALEAIKFCLENDLRTEALIHTFTNGNLFLKRLLDTSFNLIVMDLEMPEISGIDLIEKIKSLKNHTPIIVLTGNAQLLRNRFEIHKFIFEALIKPVEYRQLLKIIREGLTYSHFFSDSLLQTKNIKVYKEVLRLNKEIKSKILSNENQSVVFELLDSQERIIRFLQKDEG